MFSFEAGIWRACFVSVAFMMVGIFWELDIAMVCILERFRSCLLMSNNVFIAIRACSVLSDSLITILTSHLDTEKHGNQHVRKIIQDFFARTKERKVIDRKGFIHMLDGGSALDVLKVGMGMGMCALLLAHTSTRFPSGVCNAVVETSDTYPLQGAFVLYRCLAYMPPHLETLTRPTFSSSQYKVPYLTLFVNLMWKRRFTCLIEERT